MPHRHQQSLMRWMLLAILASGLWACDSNPPIHADVAAPPPIPLLVRQSDGRTAVQLSGEQIPGMTTVEVTQIELPGVLETNGHVDFDDKRVATISSRVAGRIDNVRVSQWDNVRRGEPILSLYSPDFMTAEAEYLQAQTTAQVSSAPGLGGGGLNLGPAMLAAAKRKLELLGMSDADIAEIRLPSPTVWMRAPIGGTIVESKVVRGAAVNPGDQLFTVGTLDQVWIVANIYEDDLSRISLGQPLDAVTTAYPDLTFKGFISRISPDVNADTHTLEIRCQVDNTDGKLKPQMLARVSIVTRPGEALSVPMEALVFDTNDYYVYVDLGGGRYERRKVQIGAWKDEGPVRILAGLTAGERVVAGESIQVNALWHQANGESS
jgi:membrane fusion protein, copper/silver efflux system